MENSTFGRLLGALVSPAATFRSLAERPTWLAALLAVCLSGVVAGVIAGPKIDWEDVVRTQMERSGQDVPAAQIEQGIAMWEKIGPFLVYIGPFMMAFALLVFALVFWGAFTLAGGQLGFKRSLAVVSHGMMPWVVSALLSIPVVMSADRIGGEQLESGSYLQSSLAAFASEDAGPVLIALLSKLDVFTLWSVVLLAIGYRFVAKVPPRTAALTVGLLWAIYVAVNVGFAALGAAFAGGGS
jgi:hypothetical protein